MTQTIRVNYYAQLREALKTASEEVAVELPARERDILERLAALHPRQRDLFLASRVAVDEGYVNAQSLLDGLSGVDIISPISGG
ncbi:MAG TPA: MoaD/ThiS family protein [Fibrobacteria bacterium]|nr:MoaD/ThiS family protein [Fibrobacteria bacterium]